jgi:hypothetical protein
MEAAMALLDDILNGGNLTTGLVIGAGVLIAWPLVGPIAWPVAKNLIKAGMMAYGQAEQLYASAAESIGDIIAEVQQEVGAAPRKTLADGNGSQAA